MRVARYSPPVSTVFLHCKPLTSECSVCQRCPGNMKRHHRPIYRDYHLTMDFGSEASPWAIRGLTEDIFGVRSEYDTADSNYPRQSHTGFPSQLRREFLGWDPRCTCAGMCVQILLANVRVDSACVDALRDGRHRTPSPSIACIDPRLTVLWPSPPASPSEEGSSVDDGWSAFDDWRQESPRARVPGTCLHIA